MIKIRNITHIYQTKNIAFKALDDISLDIVDQKFNILVGKSGSGKTTLLNIVGGLLKPTSGEVFVNDINIYTLSDLELSNFRKDNFGFVFQNFFLEDNFTALENVMIPLFLNEKLTNQQRIKQAKLALEQVGLKDKVYNKPTELSGGECQRVSIARALVNHPSLIIADEPTGNLDSENGNHIIEILRNQVSLGKTVLLVTHNTDYIKDNDIVFSIKDGKI